MKELVNTYINLIFKTGIILVVLSSFFLFTNLTTEFYDTAKLISLIIFTGIMLLLLTLKFTLNNKIVLIRTALDLPLLLLLAVAAVSTILSASPYVALLGNQLRVHGSLISLIFYVLFYFVLVNSLKNLKDIKWILYLTLAAAQVLAVISLISYAGVKILPNFLIGTNFTPTGSSFSTTAVLALLIPITVSQILSSNNLITKVVNALLLTLMGTTIVLTGTAATWIAAVFALILTFLVIFPVDKIEQIISLNPVSLISLTVPLILITLVTILSFVPPVKGVKNPIYTQAQNFPREIQLGFNTSWKIAVSAFRDSPFWGTGPATFLFNFTNYKPIEFNSTKNWNLRFDSAFNEYFQTLATLGGVGLIALLSLTAMYISSVSKLLMSETALNAFKHDLKRALAVSGLTFFVILALHSSAAVVWMVGILILASVMVLNLSENLQKSWGSTQDLKKMLVKIALNVSSPNSTQETIKIEALPSILLTISMASVLGMLYFGGKIVIADYHHRLGLNAVTQNNGILAYNELVKAEKLNSVNDLYRTDLAQINFALANAIATAKGPTESSSSGSLTDQDKINIQNLLQQSINEGRVAVTLSPRSAINWEILGLMYRQIAGVAQNALVFSLDSYGRAIFQDPLNPALRLNVGGVYYAIKNYDLAIRFFTDSINLKPDFANGYYNLSVALKDKGDLNSATVAAEKVVELVDKNSQDYKLASDYLKDLKSKAQVPTEPPAASASGQLQNENLPKVLDVGTPEKIATPEAVKKPAATSKPSPKP